MVKLRQHDAAAQGCGGRDGMDAGAGAPRSTVVARKYYAASRNTRFINLPFALRGSAASHDERISGTF